MKKGGRGKSFENVIRDAFDIVPDVSVTRLKDDTFKSKGVKNPCDFIVYHKPYLYAIECKSKHSDLLSIYSITKDPNKPHDYGDITNGQWEGLLEMSTVKGVYAGVICWWVNQDVTMFLPIQMLKAMRDNGAKSIRYDCDMFVDKNNKMHNATVVKGKKKRVYFDYDMQVFLDEMES